MAQSSIIDGFEPWLKVLFFGGLSHGSKLIIDGFQSVLSFQPDQSFEVLCNLAYLCSFEIVCIMSAQSIPKKMKQQSILNIMKSKKVDEKNVGPEPAGFILSDQLKTELKEFVAKELCVMKEEYECMYKIQKNPILS